MKKILLSIMILVLLCSGCFNKDESDKKDDVVEKYDESYIEKIPENAKDFIKELDNTLILSTDEIKEYNEKIKSKTRNIRIYK